MAEMTKNDLEVLKRQLAIENAIILKYKSYVKMASDPIVRGLCESIVAQHVGHFNSLLSLME